jgi:hypothetical protein
LASHVSLAPGEKIEYWIKFGQPTKGVKHSTLNFRQAEPIEVIPSPPAGK